MAEQLQSIKADESHGFVLDYLVAMALWPNQIEKTPPHWFIDRPDGCYLPSNTDEGNPVDGWYPSSCNPAQAYPIIEGCKIATRYDAESKRWIASGEQGGQTVSASGETLLRAAMRCFVVMKLGREVKVPAVMIEAQNSD